MEDSLDNLFPELSAPTPPDPGPPSFPLDLCPWNSHSSMIVIPPNAPSRLRLLGLYLNCCRGSVEPDFAQDLIKVFV
ncbi:unnamed protein product [Allacma fusca]|uniref:Uncharacterized protein n=1 Tax=Allacma fusca TaxID=39272 RepID=A0A8J2P1M3_9HEXA|nr:unnamed protein product [Allacma fusca]